MIIKCDSKIQFIYMLYILSNLKFIEKPINITNSRVGKRALLYTKNLQNFSK